MSDTFHAFSNIAHHVFNLIESVYHISKFCYDFISFSMIILIMNIVKNAFYFDFKNAEKIDLSSEHS